MEMRHVHYRSHVHVHYTHLEVEQTDFLHVLQSRNDPLLIAEVLHTTLQPVQLLALPLLERRGGGGTKGAGRGGKVRGEGGR